ncbi:hypothetical protein QZH41_014408 [Actinostola sp. cb2023]|nr:hypothetical protein QZH41_014408 [Actinostola sp. cb2023]
MIFYMKLVALVLVLPCAYSAANMGGFNTEKIRDLILLLLGSVGFHPIKLDRLTMIALAVAFVVVSWFLYKLWQLLFVPMKLFRSLGDTGYIPDGIRPIRDIAKETKRQRRTGDLPPVYPNGWFHILSSWEVKLKEVKFVCVLGEHLAVFRGEDGAVSIIDAYCPHLGANLAIGGQIVGDCIKCPFHGWEFRGTDGMCTKIPYTKNIPSVAKVKAWPCLERNCSIMLWYHAEGAEPSWLPEEVEEITNGEWVYGGQTTHVINAHCEEIPENGADINHLDHLHGSPILAGADLRYIFSSKWLEIMHHAWDASWSVDESNKHVGLLTLKHAVRIFGYRLPLLDFFLSARQIGPGLVYMYFTSFFGNGIFLHTVTPEEPLLQRVEHRMYSSSYMPTIIAKFYLYGESIQIERDIMIWNHKKYMYKALLVKEDHLIGKHRRWYSQFYSENSPSYADAMSKGKHAEW